MLGRPARRIDAADRIAAPWRLRIRR